jgi:hypothetical protein
VWLVDNVPVKYIKIKNNRFGEGATWLYIYFRLVFYKCIKKSLLKKCILKILIYFF